MKLFSIKTSLFPSALLAFCLILSPPAFGDQWADSQIADAIRAAPPSVTNDAQIYAWKKTGETAELVKVRDGSGPYKCVASGSWSIRVGKQKRPHPDSFCADQNAWAFFQAVWEKKPLPTAPGMCWMLAGMNVPKGKGFISMSPHIMIIPLPVDEGAAGLPSSYNEDDPYKMWIMLPGKKAEHLHVHFPEKVLSAIMNPTGK
jgi:hypothetical protein